MAEKTKIEWCDATFSPWWGCHKLSPACDNCYAQKAARRYGFNVWGAGTGVSRRHFGNKHWNEPLLWNKKAAAEGRRWRVFCGSMCDVFEDRADLVDEHGKLWDLIESTPSLDWLLLTKRPAAFAHIVPESWKAGWPSNAHPGVTAEDQQYADERLPELLKVPAVVHWISAEPLLGAIDLSKWFGYYPVHETDDARRKRLQSGTARGVADRPQGPDMAREGEARGQMEGWKPSRNLPSAAGGERRRGIPTGPGHVPGNPVACNGASDGMAAFQRADTTGPDSQSSQREEEGQQTSQSGIEDIFRPNEAHDRRAQEGEGTDAVRRDECDGEADRGGRTRDSSSPKGGRIIEGDSAKLRSIGSDDIKDRSRRAMGISWCIVGGESGLGARRMDIAWARLLRDQCWKAGVPFFMKQFGTVWAHNHKSKSMKGDIPHEWPKEFRIRQFPAF